MKLSNKEKILIALYVTYKKDYPCMESEVTAEKLGLPYNQFVFELHRLNLENLIKNITFAYASGQPSIAWYKNVIVTEDGQEYIENKIGIEKTLSRSEKIKYIIGKSIEFGWNEAKDILAKAMAESIKG